MVLLLLNNFILPIKELTMAKNTASFGRYGQKNKSIRNNKMPQRNQFKTDEDFNKALKEWEKRNK